MLSQRRNGVATPASPASSAATAARVPHVAADAAVPTSAIRANAGRATAANAVDEARILDVGYELLLAIGMRRMTMADISRRARVSRATLYRRWPNVRAVVAALVTREWSAIAAASFEASAAHLTPQAGPTSQSRSTSEATRTCPPSARRRLVEGIVSAVHRSREHPLLRKIIDLDPEFLLPYLLRRRGSSTDEQLELIERELRAGHADGSVRTGDASWQARALLLTALSFTLTGPIMAGPDDYPRLDDELRALLDRYVLPDHRWSDSGQGPESGPVADGGHG